MAADWKDLFIGRDTEVERLLDLWRKVREGRPELVVLRAESGLGKTRLVQEFYRRLSVDHDGKEPKGYWPDAFENRQGASLDVNPVFPTGWKPRGRVIPWLWWGLRATCREPGAGRRNLVGSDCALVDGLEFLRPHIEAMTRAQRRKRKIARTATSVGALAADALSLGGVSTVLGAYEVIKDLAGLARLAREADEGPSERRDRSRADRAELTLAFLETVLEKGSRGGAGLPVILVLDDAQWLDPLTVRFTRDLLARAEDEGWPLMVLATHWETEWQFFEAEERQDPPRRLAHVTRPGPLVIDVGVIPDLSTILKAALPGLTQAQHKMLVDRAGGNPLMMHEMILHLLSRPTLYFKDRNPSHALTAECARNLRLAVLDLGRLVSDRFYALEAKVQDLLGWSSAQGMRFLGTLTLEVARRLNQFPEVDAVEALRLAEIPYAFVGSRGDLREFRQAVFHDVAHQHLEGIPGHEHVYEVLRTVAGEWVSLGRISHLDSADRRLLLEFVCREFAEPPRKRGGSSPEDRVWLTASARLLQDLLDERLWHQARGVALDVFAACPPGGFPLETLPFKDQWMVIDTLRDLEELDAAKAVAFPLPDRLAGANARSDPEAARHLAVALALCGDISEDLEYLGNARDYHSRALAVRRDILKVVGDTERALRELGWSLDSLGNLASTQEEYREAAGHFDEALTIAVRAVERFEGQRWTLRALAGAYDNLGHLALDRGNHPEAQDCFTKGLETRQRIVQQDKAEPGAASDLGISFDNLGTVALIQGDLESARKYFEQGLAIQTRMVEREAGHPLDLRDQARSFENLGRVARDASELVRAQEFFDRAWTLRKRIVEGSGSSQRDLEALLDDWMTRGELARALGQSEAARDHYEESRKVLERIVARYEFTSREPREWVVCLCHLGEVTRILGDVESAGKQLKKAWSHLEWWTSIFGPRSLAAQRDLAESLDSISSLATSLEEYWIVKESLAMALEIRARIVRDHGKDAESLKHLVKALVRNSGYADAPKERRDALEDALDYSRQGAALAPADPFWSRSVDALEKELGALRSGDEAVP